MAWRVLADFTYTTAANKTTAQSNVQTALDAVGADPVAGRFPAGITSQSSTRFTVCVDVDTAAQAQSIEVALRTGAMSLARSQSLFSYHNIG